MKAKHPTLPPQIVKVYKNFYQDSRDGRLIHKDNLWKECPMPVNNELKDEYIRSRRYDLNYD